MVGTGLFSRVLWCKCFNIWFLVHFTISSFIFDLKLVQAKLSCFKSNRKMKLLGAFWLSSLHYLISHYLISHKWCDEEYLEVTLEEQESTRPVFLCSEPEYMVVRKLSCAVFRSRALSRRFFFLTININHAKKKLDHLRILCYRRRQVTWT